MQHYYTAVKGIQKLSRIAFVSGACLFGFGLSAHAQYNPGQPISPDKIIMPDASKLTTENIAKTVIYTNLKLADLEKDPQARIIFRFAHRGISLREKDGVDRMWIDTNDNGRYDDGVDRKIPWVKDVASLDYAQDVNTAQFKPEMADFRPEIPQPEEIRKRGEKFTIYGPITGLEVIHRCKIYDIDVTENPYLAYLYLQHTDVKKVDLTKNSILVGAFMWDNDLEEVAISGANQDLRKMEIQNNNLSYHAIMNIVNRLPQLPADQPGKICLYQEAVFENADKPERNVLPELALFHLKEKNWIPRAYYNNELGSIEMIKDEGTNENIMAINLDNGDYQPIEKYVAISNQEVVSLNLNVYPTITVSQLNVEMPTVGARRYQIFSFEGVRVAEGMLQEGLNTLNVAQLSNGNYILSVEGDPYRFAVRK